MKKLALIAAILVGILTVPGAVMAEEQVCSQVYGGGVVCGAKTEPHKPVNTALGDINPIVLGSIFIMTSGAILLASKRINSRLSSRI